VNGNEQYLFTGDLEEKGEKGLVDHYGTELGHCTLFKGGHHGSSTSSNEVLMDIVTPDYVIICTCAGSSEYSPTPSNQFPTQEFINRIAKYTDNVYVTTVMYDNSTRTYGSLNGNIIFSVTDGEVTIICSASDNKLKDTEWFKTYRVVPEKWAAADAG
jgi:competence protein ComEC